MEKISRSDKDFPKKYLKIRNYSNEGGLGTALLVEDILNKNYYEFTQPLKKSCSWELSDKGSHFYLDALECYQFVNGLGYQQTKKLLKRYYRIYYACSKHVPRSPELSTLLEGDLDTIVDPEVIESAYQDEYDEYYNEFDRKGFLEKVSNHVFQEELEYLYSEYSFSALSLFADALCSM